ncbi:LysR family transcriptional regulator [Gammaproteobacteria bacterium LSUCC0057]|uniref:LysR family transcriptional regulator n=1 Tax=Gammaproteobacteria bacterium LSUCC0057 TaxID=2559237 RepID=A0A4Y8UKH7_9GAMM|nr:LysR family transcriptional regulator [Gammaproteobacteria bacterium LSUCC0057]
MKNLPTELLRSFATIADVGGFTPAGELLGRSQPAVSLQIKRLEALVGQPLFRRGSTPLELTAAGETLLGYSRQILALNDSALAQLSDSPLSGKIRFGIPSEFASSLMPKILGRFSKSYPNISLEITCALSRQLLADKQRQRYDLILALHDDPRDSLSELILVDELIWVGGAAPLLANHTALPLVVAPEGCIYRKRGLERLRQINRKWQISYTNPDLSGLQTAIEQGLGITVLAKSTVPDSLYPLASSAGLPELGQIGISLIVPDNGNNAAVDRLSEFVRSSLQSP